MQQYGALEHAVSWPVAPNTKQGTHPEKYYTGRAVAAPVGGALSCYSLEPPYKLFIIPKLISIILSSDLTHFWAASIWLEHKTDDPPREDTRQA